VLANFIYGIKTRDRRGEVINNRFVATLGCVLLAAVSQGAGARGFDYSYAELGYTRLNSDPFDASGVNTELSIAAGDHVHFKGGYSRLWVDNVKGSSKDNIDIDSFRIGMGGNFSVLEKVDLTGTASFIDNENSGDNNNSDRGYELEFGARVQALKKLEMTPSVIRVHTDNYEATGYSLGLVYALNKQYSIRTRVRKFSDDDVTDFFAGVRLNF
jgi:Outer membrane protein beta-barrel domain